MYFIANYDRWLFFIVKFRLHDIIHCGLFDCVCWTMGYYNTSINTCLTQKLTQIEKRILFVNQTNEPRNKFTSLAVFGMITDYIWNNKDHSKHLRQRKTFSFRMTQLLKRRKKETIEENDVLDSLI